MAFTARELKTIRDYTQRLLFPGADRGGALQMYLTLLLNRAVSLEEVQTLLGDQAHCTDTTR